MALNYLSKGYYYYLSMLIVLTIQYLLWSHVILYLQHKYFIHFAKRWLQMAAITKCLVGCVHSVWRAVKTNHNFIMCQNILWRSKCWQNKIINEWFVPLDLQKFAADKQIQMQCSKSIIMRPPAMQLINTNLWKRPLGDLFLHFAKVLGL